jgi:hypothetical protein
MFARVVEEYGWSGFDEPPLGAIFMGKKGRQKFTEIWANQTELGKQFGLSAIAMGKKLKELGLRGEDGNPTPLALCNGYCTPTPLKDGTPFFMWNRQQVEELMQAHGHQRLDPQEVKARELAESWVQVHRQWQEAVYGVEEELLMEEAQDIKREVRHRGLTERVNALLRERKFEGELIS